MLKFNLLQTELPEVGLVDVYDLWHDDPLVEFCMAQTQQMSMDKGIKEFGAAGTAAVHKEMLQLHERNTIIPVDVSKMSRGSRMRACEYLMFLKRKRDETIKARGCADGRNQRKYVTKEESSSPTISIEAVMITSVIEAAEHRDVATVDIPGAYMSADMDEVVHVRFRGVMAQMLEQIDPERYKKYTVVEKGKPVIYAALNN